MIGLFDGLNVHHKFKISLKKPLGSSNSFINRTISHPLPALIGGGLGMAYTDMKANAKNKQNEFNREQQAAADEAAAAAGDLEAMARLEEGKRQALGKQQQQQILGFADEQEKRGTDYRSKLAASLASTGRGVFERENPNILEDLNSRGLFTSQTARDQEQGRLLKDIALNEQQQLGDFDTNQFNEISDIRGTGLSALLGGDQSALDSALELRKAGIQRRFDEADAKKEQSYADMLARRQSRDQLIGGIFGLGGSALIGLCFDPSTPVRLRSGNVKEMRDVEIGDELSDGGIVFSVRDAVTGGDFFDYKGVRVTGEHAVREGGKWVRVKNSDCGSIFGKGGAIRSLGTTSHRLFINGIEFADEFETDDFGKLTLDESLQLLGAGA